MQTNKQIKIVVVGVGHTGCVLVDNMSKEENRDNIKFVQIDWAFDESNPKTTDIKLPSAVHRKTSLEEVLVYLKYKQSKERLEQLLSLVQEGDELYKLQLSHVGCIRCASDMIGIRLKRDGKTVDFVEINYSV
jgi:DNA-binding transcriptional regulator LsrR (DeoR family)